MTYPTFESMYLTQPGAHGAAPAAQPQGNAAPDPQQGNQDAGQNPWDQHMDMWASTLAQNPPQQQTGKK